MAMTMEEAQLIKDISLSLKKQIDEINQKLDMLVITQVDLKKRVEALEARKPTEIHNHYHPPTPQPWQPYQPPFTYGNGAGDPIPPNHVTCGGVSGS